MYRNLLIAVAILTLTPTLRADFAIYYLNPRTGQYQMTQTAPSQALAEASAAVMRKNGDQVVVVDRANPGIAATPTQPAAPVQSPAAQTPAASAPVQPVAQAWYVLQTSVKGTNVWRTIGEATDLPRLQLQARDHQKGGYEVRILNKADVAPTPYRMDPVPANLPLIGTWDIHLNTGGIGKDFTMEITHLQGSTFTFRVPFSGQGQGEFNAKAGTIRFHHNGQAYTGNVRHSPNGGWSMGGFISTSAQAATDWTGKRQ